MMKHRKAHEPRESYPRVLRLEARPHPVLPTGQQVTLDTPTHSCTPLPPWRCEPAALAPISSYYWTAALAVLAQRLSATKTGKDPGVGFHCRGGGVPPPAPKNFQGATQAPSHTDEVTYQRGLAEFRVAKMAAERVDWKSANAYFS